MPKPPEIEILIATAHQSVHAIHQSKDANLHERARAWCAVFDACPAVKDWHPITDLRISQLADGDDADALAEIVVRTLHAVRLAKLEQRATEAQLRDVITIFHSAWRPPKEAEMAARFQVFKDKAGEYRWRLRATNGEPIADSGEGYARKDDCVNGIERVKKLAPDAPIEFE